MKSEKAFILKILIIMTPLLPPTFRKKYFFISQKL